MRSLKVVAQFTCYILLGFGTVSATVVRAQTTDAAATENATTDQSPPSRESEFLGLGFSAGISLTIDGGSRKRIESASVVNGIVRVDDENDTRARVMLESHYFFETPHKFLRVLDAKNWGHGPFVAVQPGSNEIIEAVGLGWMVGFKRNGGNNDNSSWNIGIGVAVDPNVQTLGDGLVENMALPEGEQGIRFREETETGGLILVSFTF